MKLKLTFKKLAQRWFVDIPWIGSIDDLQMVNGADDFLEWYAAGITRCVAAVVTFIASMACLFG